MQFAAAVKMGILIGRIIVLVFQESLVRLLSLSATLTKHLLKLWRFVQPTRMDDCALATKLWTLAPQIWDVEPIPMIVVNIARDSRLPLRTTIVPMVISSRLKPCKISLLQALPFILPTQERVRSKYMRKKAPIQDLRAMQMTGI